MIPFTYKRIVVVGTTSSGKSTLAERLANKLEHDFIELDALHWEPGWKDAPLDVFRERVETATRARAWVVAGNYSSARDIVWSRAEAVVWLDYPFPSSSAAYGGAHGGDGGTRRNCGTATARASGLTSNSGRKNRCFTGCLEPTGAGSGSIPCYYPCRRISI
jgi:hypothetical protein